MYVSVYVMAGLFELRRSVEGERPHTQPPSPAVCLCFGPLLRKSVTPLSAGAEPGALQRSPLLMCAYVLEILNVASFIQLRESSLDLRLQGIKGTVCRRAAAFRTDCKRKMEA